VAFYCKLRDAKVCVHSVVEKIVRLYVCGIAKCH